MSGKSEKFWISLACVILLLMIFQASGTSAAPGVTVKPGASGVQDSASKAEEQEQDTTEWRTGVITLPPHTAAKTRQTMILISDVPYVLSKSLVIVEKFEEKPGGNRSERPAGMAALGNGTIVSFAVVGADHTIITKMVIDSIPLRN
ncbi:MAG: hypothetical protein AB9866_30060 [Syntrophobacteraceae bacterium]